MTTLEERLKSALAKFGSRRIAVVGDLMLDRFLVGDTSRISPEAPVPVLHVKNETAVPGGAANVAVNLATLGAKAGLCGIVGEDHAGKTLSSILKERSVDVDGILADDCRLTVVKQRLMAKRHQMLRCDFENTEPLSPSTVSRLIDRGMRLVSEADAVICSDYAKGVIHPEITAWVLKTAAGKPTFIDPKSADFRKYAGFSYITPNEKEFMNAFHVLVTDDDRIRREVFPKVRDNGWRGLVVTCGERGVTLITEENILRIPAQAVEVFDVVGAGDTFIASLALGLSSGLEIAESCALANIGAAIVVSKVGTAHTSTEEIAARLSLKTERFPKGLQPNGWEDTDHKIRTSDEARSIVEVAKRQGRKVVFTNGCFDILHRGHVHILREARKTGDFLIAGVNTDESVRGLKGPSRPVFPEADRMEMLANFPFVDLVVPFAEATPMKLIETLGPDILVKGADYKRSEVVGGDLVEARGGKVVLVDLLPGRSTSSALLRAVES